MSEFTDNSNYKILLVDDTPKNIQLLASVLSGQKYQLGYAQNGKQALEIVTKSSFDLILLDVMMPEIDGFEVCRHLKSDNNTKEIPIIFLTAKTDEASIIKGFEAGGTDYLTKPFNSAELLARVKTHLQANLTKRQLIEVNSQLRKEIEGRQAAELKLSIVASETDNGVIIFDAQGNLEWQNISMGKLFAESNVQENLKIGKHITTISENPDISIIFNKCINTKQSQIYETEHLLKNGSSKWMQTTMTPFFNNSNTLEKIITIDTDISAIKKAESEIREQNIKITDSIHYALRIQRAILPPKSKLSIIFPESFLLLRPKDIVSGDFFWITETDSRYFVAAVDCTGHGVPGALMSIIGSNLLNKAIMQHKLIKPSEILDFLNDAIKSTLQSDQEQDIKDGMDIALCSFTKDYKVLEYAGAYNPLFLVRNNDLTIIKADSNPIGERMVRNQLEFTNNSIDLLSGDRIYLFSDGYQDQFGGNDKRKFLKKRFKQLILDIQNANMNNQKLILEKTLDDWRGELQQIDDVLVIGIEI